MAFPNTPTSADIDGGGNILVVNLVDATGSLVWDAVYPTPPAGLSVMVDGQAVAITGMTAHTDVAAGILGLTLATPIGDTSNVLLSYVPGSLGALGMPYVPMNAFSNFACTVNAQVYGQTDALAVAVATMLEGMENGFCLPIAAERRFLLLSDIKDIPTITYPVSVDIFPDLETSERAGMSTAFKSELAIHLYIQQNVEGAANQEYQCALLSRLRSQIIEAIKTRSFNLTNAVHPVNRVFLYHFKNADKMGLYSLSRLVESRLFESDTILFFRQAA